MAKKKGLFIGLGCLALIVVAGIAAMLVASVAKTRLPGNIIVSLRFAGPIVEVAAEDPFAELTGNAPTSLRDIRRALVRAAEDDRVKGVRLRIDRVGGGFATVQEIRALLGRVRAAGKWTAVYMDTAGEFSPGNIIYYLASACDEISINPAGDVNLIGLSARSPFIRGTFDKLGIKPEFPGRGTYKTARFMYTETDFTPGAREMTAWLLGSIMDQMVGDIATGRTMEPGEVKHLIDTCPMSAPDAVTAGLVDHLEDWTAFQERISTKDEGKTKVVGLHRYLTHLKKSSGGARIAVITATGAIMRGESGKSMNPLFGGDIMGSETIAKAWRDLRKAKNVKAAVFRIDSPGGSAVASEIIRQEMIRVAETMPVVVSMSNLAASGGYWITCGAKHIVADPGTLTASIGVFGGHFNTEKFWSEKLGVTYGKMDWGANANIYGELEDWTDPQRAIIDGQLDRIYGDFLQRVAQSRGKTTEEVHAMAEGRVFTGVQALEKGLIDELGGFDTALAAAKNLAGIDADTKVKLLDYPKVLPWWQQMLEKKKGEETAIATLNRWVRTGRIETPGCVWMPPITIE
jgi:protease-4